MKFKHKFLFIFIFFLFFNINCYAVSIDDITNLIPYEFLTDTKNYNSFCVNYLPIYSNFLVVSSSEKSTAFIFLYDENGFSALEEYDNVGSVRFRGTYKAFICDINSNNQIVITNTIRDINNGFISIASCFSEYTGYTYDIDSLKSIFTKYIGSVYNFDDFFFKKTIVSTKDITLFIDDMNFRKRFSFQFHIPLEKEDTKYFVFLDKYKRNTYNSVTASFVIYTVATPEDYDYSEYENYMYYDDLSKKMFLPAGCTIKKYSCTLNNGTKAAELTLDEEFVAERLNIGSFFKHLSYSGSVFIEDNYNYSSLIPTSYIFDDFSASRFVGDLLSHLSFFNKTDNTSVSVSTQDLLKYADMPSLSDFAYYYNLYTLYYGVPELKFSFDDFCFSNNPIVSYEHKKLANTNYPSYYFIYRKTKVYNLENQINENMFAIQYTDNQDVSSLLPDGIDVGYLTSPFYEENKNSSSGGNLTYNIDEILNGDKILDYSKEDNSIHNNFNGDYIENFEEGDNITINNNYTTIIDKTSDENILHNIYIEVLQIKTLLAGMGDSTSNYINNFTYNIENNVQYFFIPSKNYLINNFKEYNTQMKNHLGIIYQPVEFLIYTLGLFSEMDNTTEILLDIPEISFKEHTLIPSTKFSFTNYFNELPILNQIHEIYLTAVDFVILGLLIKYATKVYKEVFKK